MSSFTPIKFLGATVLSFNADVGLGSTDVSRLTVELIEDCVDGDLIELKDSSPNQKIVGAPVYFTAGAFNFGGVITSFTANQNSGGETYTVNLEDPRELLQNVVVVTDTYVGTPTIMYNYINVYNYYEGLSIKNPFGGVLEGKCEVYGSSLSDNTGMSFQMVINGLAAMDSMDPIYIYPPTASESPGDTYKYRIDFTSFPGGLPEYYRVPGPSINLLELLQNICDVIGLDFYVNLQKIGGFDYITVGIIDLKVPVTSFESVIGPYDGYATSISYGQELRNNITKSVLFGGPAHYFSSADNFLPYFGDDLYGTEFFPVIPFGRDDCGFYINKKIDTLNGMLDNPLPSNGPYVIHELDIRAAMSSFDMWIARVSISDIPGSFNAAVRNKFPLIVDEGPNNIRNIILKWLNDVEGPNPISDAGILKKNLADINSFETMTQLEIIHNWIKQLGATYYGKQFLSPLNQKICYYQPYDDPFAERVFSDVPTKEGAWVDDGVPVLGLSDPELSTFREEDNRIGCFALFNDSGENDSVDPPTGANSTIGN